MKSTPEILFQISTYQGNDLGLLTNLIYAIRPSSKELKQQNFEKLNTFIKLLEGNKNYCDKLGQYLGRLLQNKELHTFLSEEGLLEGISFLSELKKRLVYKILPHQANENTIQFVIENVFVKEKDGLWIKSIPINKLQKIYSLLGFVDLTKLSNNSFIFKEIIISTRVLMHRILGISYHPKILRMVPEFSKFENPFEALQNEIIVFTDDFLNNKPSPQLLLSYKQIKVLINQCENFIETALHNRTKYGISLTINQNLISLRNFLVRISDLLQVLGNHQTQNAENTLLEFFQKMIDYHAGNTLVTKYITDSTQVIANEITLHTGKKGEHYITSSKKEYNQMFNSALGGGAIVGVLCIVKVWMNKWDISLFGHAFWYSMNYAFGFIAIYLFHFTLATKQPAMTAATLAKALAEHKPGQERYFKFAQLFTKVFRSQFIAFVGNVVMAFPVALFLAFIWELFLGYNLPQAKAQKLLFDLNPFLSLAIFHASIAGVFLFLSGLIAGSVSNKTIYLQIPRRVENHPFLKRFMGLKRRQRLAGYIDRNIGGILSNFWFGVFMGSAPLLGIFFGLPIDIRHITFASGNLALGIFGSGFNVSFETVFVAILGIGIIGFMNFIVSFILSMFLAMNARGIKFKEVFPIFRSILSLLFYVPKPFFFPPNESQNIKTDTPS